jgi:hypothetical protein
MIIIHGTRLYGKVDQVPGLFFIATSFFYLQFIPLFPLGSFLVLEGTTKENGGFSGRKLGWSGKSIFFAYLRLALFLGGCFVAVVALIDAIEMLERNGAIDWGSIGGMLATSLVLFATFGMSYRFTHARPTRALELARHVGIPPETVAKFFAHKLRPKDMDELSEHLQYAGNAGEESVSKVDTF